MATKTVPNNKYEKMVKEQAHAFKLDIMEQFCKTVHEALVEPDEDGLIVENVRDRELFFTKIEYNKTFGIFHLHYKDRNNSESTYRLSFELKRA